ncbi:unnamed protein product [Urochloa humidicola]
MRDELKGRRYMVLEPPPEQLRLVPLDDGGIETCLIDSGKDLSTREVDVAGIDPLYSDRSCFPLLPMLDLNR